MLTPTVTEVPRRLERVCEDPFADDGTDRRPHPAAATIAAEVSTGGRSFLPRALAAAPTSQRDLVLASLWRCPRSARAADGRRR